MVFLISTKSWKTGRRVVCGSAWLAVLAVFLSDVWPLDAQPATARPYQLKAVFLFNFAQFVEWPATAFPEAQAPFVIGVLGDNPFGPYLDETVRGEVVNQHPLTIQHYRRTAEIKTCHILFISPSETKHLDQIFADLKGRSILIVGESDGFAQHGGMIRFVTENHKIRFRVNLAAAKAASLIISSKLLRSAEIIASEKD